MKHKGFEIRPAEKQGPVVKITGQGIYDGDKLLSIATSVELAKRAIDSHIKSGYWRKTDGETSA